MERERGVEIVGCRETNKQSEGNSPYVSFNGQKQTDFRNSNSRGDVA